MTPLDHPEDALPDDFEDGLLSRCEASIYLESIGVRRKSTTLAKLYCTAADGPPCVHDGRRVLYPKRLLHLWGMGQLSVLRRRSRKTRAQTAAAAEGASA